MSAQHVTIRWKITPDAVERHREMLRTVYAELESARPEILRYDTYQSEDEVSFVSFVELADGPGVLGGLPAFQHYRAALDAMCEEPPELTTLQPVGTYTTAT